MTTATTIAAPSGTVRADVGRAMLPQAGDKFLRDGDEVLVTAVTRDGRVLHRLTHAGSSVPYCVPLDEWARLVYNTMDRHTRFVPANMKADRP